MNLGAMPARVTICEVGPRDGLQNEKALVSAADRIAFTEALIGAGSVVTRDVPAGATAFGNPARVQTLP